MMLIQESDFYTYFKAFFQEDINGKTQSTSKREDQGSDN